VSMLKLRVGLLGLLAMLLLGAFAAAPALAEGGPWWHHREVGGKDEGKITEQKPEKITGEGEEQILNGKLLGEPIEISAKGLSVTGEIYNNEDQAQAKLHLTYKEPKLIKPKIEHCKVTIGENNTVPVYFHQGWTWNGTVGQLEVKPQKAEQKRDWIALPVDLKQQLPVKNHEVELPKEEFTKITLSSEGGTCLLASKDPVDGSVAVEAVSPVGLEAWSTTEEDKIIGSNTEQHFWNGKEWVGVKIGLTFAGAEATLNGKAKLKTAKQEVALFES